MKEADDILAEASSTFKSRKAVYGNNYLRCGAALAAMFPEGVVLQTADDWNRMHIYMLILVKLSRYAVSWNNLGHKDSVHDAAVYAAMLESIDDNIKDRCDGEEKCTSDEIQALLFGEEGDKPRADCERQEEGGGGRKGCCQDQGPYSLPGTQGTVAAAERDPPPDVPGTWAIDHLVVKI